MYTLYFTTMLIFTINSIQVIKLVLKAICLEEADDGSPASTILTPFKLMGSIFNWILANIAYTIIRSELNVFIYIFLKCCDFSEQIRPLAVRRGNTDTEGYAA